MENNEETYYKKILITSGEVPETDGDYITDQGLYKYTTELGFIQTKDNPRTPNWWMKPYSPKQKAVKFANWLTRIVIDCIKKQQAGKEVSDKLVDMETCELYDKFDKEND